MVSLSLQRAPSACRASLTAAARRGPPRFALPAREGCRPARRRGSRPFAVLALSLLCLAPVSADRATAAAQFQAGNDAYKAGDFVRASDAYLQAWAAGGTGPNLCHNLANTYYKLQDAPRALLWYRRAGAVRRQCAARFQHLPPWPIQLYSAGLFGLIDHEYSLKV